MTAAFTRWTPTRKAALCRSINTGATTVLAALEQHDLSVGELSSWLERYAAHGVDGLAVKKLQEIRA